MSDFQKITTSAMVHGEKITAVYEGGMYIELMCRGEYMDVINTSAYERAEDITQEVLENEFSEWIKETPRESIEGFLIGYGHIKK